MSNTFMSCKDLLDLLNQLPKGPFEWRQCYEMSRWDGDYDMHWAICDPENDTEGRISDIYTVLMTCQELAMDGQPISEQDMPKALLACLNNMPRILGALDLAVARMSHLARELNKIDGGDRRIPINTDDWMQGFLDG